MRRAWPRSSPGPAWPRWSSRSTSADRPALYAALDRLAEQDPLISLRVDGQSGDSRELRLSLYGEVQQQVIGSLLEEEYGVAVRFRDTAMICTERLRGTGAAVELIGTDPNPYLATVGLRVEPAPVGSGVDFGLEVELGSMPPAFFTAVETSVPVRAAARQPRLGGPRRAGADDPLRLLGAPEPRPRHLRQVHVEHGR